MNGTPGIVKNLRTNLRRWLHEARRLLVEGFVSSSRRNREGSLVSGIVTIYYYCDDDDGGGVKSCHHICLTFFEVSLKAHYVLNPPQTTMPFVRSQGTCRFKCKALELRRTHYYLAWIDAEDVRIRRQPMLLSWTARNMHHVIHDKEDTFFWKLREEPIYTLDKPPLNQRQTGLSAVAP